MTQRHKELTSAFCIFLVHMVMSTLVNKIFDNYDQMQILFYITFPLMLGLYILAFNKSRGAIWKVTLSYTRENLATRAGLKRLVLNTLLGLLLSGGIFFIIFLPLEQLGIFTLPNNNCSSVDFEYLLLSVPGQQLMFFIWPACILNKYVPKYLLVSVFAVFFGSLHGYYENTEIIILSGVCLGIPSAVLCFYQENFYAAIINHIIVGSIAIKILYLV